MKTCTKCRLPKVHFPTEMKRGKLIERAQCTDCRDAKNKAYYSTNGGYFAEYRSVNKVKYNLQIVKITRERRHERYAVIRELKEQPCTDCGGSFPYYVMDFDHRNPATKTHDVSVMVKRMFAWETVLAEVAKCDLVCVCCHRLRTYQGNNSYTTRRFVQHDTILSELKSTTPCLDCGDLFKSCQMDFDHVCDKTANIATLVGAPTEKLLAEIRKCHLVCANCHRVRGNTGVRPEACGQGDQLVQRFQEIEVRTALPADQRFVPFPFPELLGVVSDKELAMKVGLSKAMVAWYRRKAGIVLRKRAA